jgi:hypothetical protein
MWKWLCSTLVMCMMPMPISANRLSPPSSGISSMPDVATTLSTSPWPNIWKKHWTMTAKLKEFKAYVKSKGYDWERNISRFAAGRLDLGFADGQGSGSGFGYRCYRDQNSQTMMYECVRGVLCR